jgi:hypothetical protein
MRPLPPPLSREEFAIRREVLIRAGLPVTTENIDPEFWQWLQQRRASLATRRALLAVATAVVATLMLWRIL